MEIIGILYAYYIYKMYYVKHALPKFKEALYVDHVIT